ncbi:MAG: hypothetical protein HND58_01420 [Planctomycetota bacterium]|nr:MAG: hypothetical protein HND58_01420 [Planctomycetota bacterium]
MCISRSAKVLAWLGVLVVSVPCLAQNDPPAAPLITQPEVDGLILNPADVHMETGPFSDPDPGDDHLCTDWEIWTLDPAERVWVTECIGGVERVHSHLGDGVFENSHAGRDELLPETEYVLRVRHRDDSGQSNDWSPWADRLFQTGEASAIFPLELIDIAQDPAPRWEDTTGVSLALPAGSPPGVLVMDEFDGHLLLELRGIDGDSNEIVNPPALEEHAHPRVVLRAGSVSLSVPESDLIITNELGEQVTVYLPAAALEPGESAVFWISSNGSTYVGDLSQEEPDFAELARGAPVPWSVAQPGFRVEVVATGFQLPVNIAFAPDHGLRHDDDPYYYVSELYGTIKVVLRDGTVADYATGLLNFNPTGNFPGSGEQGLTGIAVDPDNGDVYAAMLYSTDPNNDNAPHYPKVVRFTSSDGGRTAATQTTVLDMVGETQGQSHQISNLTFGPDGMLYIHMGDGFDAARAQDLNSFRGKILRIDRNGWVPSDNPFYNASDGFTARDYIYTYGLRNPFGGAWRDADGSHYVVENGPSVDRFSKTVRGHNYRWDGSDQSMRNSAIYNWDPAHAPVNIAFVQPSVFGGSGFPAERHGRAFITESGPTWASGYQDRGKRVTEWILDDEGNLVEGERDVVVYNGSGKATAVAIAAGPDGLYFSDLYKDRDYTSPIDRGANILRIRYVGTAEFVADVRAGDRPLTVHFTDLSDVPGASAWEWSFGDGTGSSQQHPTHTYAARRRLHRPPRGQGHGRDRGRAEERLHQGRPVPHRGDDWRLAAPLALRPGRGRLPRRAGLRGDELRRRSRRAPDGGRDRRAVRRGRALLHDPLGQRRRRFPRSGGPGGVLGERPAADRPRAARGRPRRRGRHGVGGHRGQYTPDHRGPVSGRARGVLLSVEHEPGARRDRPRRGCAGDTVGCPRRCGDSRGRGWRGPAGRPHCPRTPRVLVPGGRQLADDHQRGQDHRRAGGVLGDGLGADLPRRFQRRRAGRFPRRARLPERVGRRRARRRLQRRRGHRYPRRAGLPQRLDVRLLTGPTGAGPARCSFGKDRDCGGVWGWSGPLHSALCRPSPSTALRASSPRVR